MVSLTFTTSGLDGLARALKATSAVSYAAPLRAAGEDLKTIAARAFRSASDPTTGMSWKPTGQLALSTRPGGGMGGKTLQDTGQLLQSLVGGAPRLGSNSVEIGGNLPYAVIHQVGGTIKRTQGDRKLYVPLTREAKVAGSARRWIAQNSDKKPVWLKSKNGRSGVMGYRDSQARFVAMFLLLESAQIPRRSYLGYSPKDVERIAKIFLANATREIAKAASKAPGGLA